MFLNVADFTFEIKNSYDYIIKQTKDYQTNPTKADYSFGMSESEISAENKEGNIGFSNGYLESICAYRKIAEWLPQNGGFVLHSAVFDVDGVGVALAAHSGTGKTTHMKLWEELLKEKFTVVNGDKPIIRFSEGNPNLPMAYGTPWNGKEHFGNNTSTPLKHICFIERSENNSCEEVTSSDAVNLILNQVYMPHTPLAMSETIKLINRLISSVKLWKIKCNMDISAAQTAYTAIFKEKL